MFMVIQAFLEFNSYMKYQKIDFKKMAIYLAIFLSACTNPKNNTEKNLELINKVVISEKDGNVIHGVTPFVYTYSDSIISIWLGEMNYCLYNVYTGNVIKKIKLDTSIITQLLELRKSISSKVYKHYTIQDYQERSLMPFEIYCVTKRKDSVDLYFGLTVASDTIIDYKGERLNAVGISKIDFVATYNKDLNKIFSIRNLYIGMEQPQFRFGGVFNTGKETITLNTKGSEAAQSFEQHDMLCKIVLQGNNYVVDNLEMPFDSFQISRSKAHKMIKMSYSKKNDNEYFVSDGNRIMLNTSNTFQDLGVRMKGELIQALHYNKSKNVIYFATTQATLRDRDFESKVYFFDLNTKKSFLLDTKKEYNSVLFLTDSTYVSIIKNEKSKLHEFETYILK